MLEQHQDKTTSVTGSVGFAARHPILSSLAVIAIVAALGFVIVYFSLAVFTRHGESDKVPAVENLSYTQAVSLLHDRGFKVDIRDSIYSDDFKPGFVIEQFPKANSIVKPGRKIFLYINAVNPKQVVIDEDNNPTLDALKGVSYRNGISRLQELGFKNVKTVRVLGANDCIVKILANGRVVKKTQRVPVNARITVEVYDGRLYDLRDSLQNLEYLESVRTNPVVEEYENPYESEAEGEGVSAEESATGQSHTQREVSSSSSSSSNEEESYEFIE